MNELDTESLKNVSRRENRTAFARVLVVTVTMSDIEYCEPDSLTALESHDSDSRPRKRISCRHGDKLAPPLPSPHPAVCMPG